MNFPLPSVAYLQTETHLQTGTVYDINSKIYYTALYSALACANWVQGDGAFYHNILDKKAAFLEAVIVYWVQQI